VRIITLTTDFQALKLKVGTRVGVCDTLELKEQDYD
jgi:hypothetical protein